jgi:hypothetical protein
MFSNVIFKRPLEIISSSLHRKFQFSIVKKRRNAMCLSRNAKDTLCIAWQLLEHCEGNWRKISVNTLAQFPYSESKQASERFSSIIITFMAQFCLLACRSPFHNLFTIALSLARSLLRLSYSDKFQFYF